MIDTHCHLTFEELEKDIEAVLERSVNAGVTGWITIGTDSEHNEKAAKLAQSHNNMYAAVGIHPHYAKNITARDIEILEQLATGKKIVAIGETGLDFHYNLSPAQQQKELFIKHLEIAKKLNLPVVIHSRNAFDETISVLDDFGSGIEKVVIHCFSGDIQQAKVVIDRGYYVSFTGVVTFHSADLARDVVRNVAADRIMLETDCPYMSPAPVRKQKINEPALMIHTAKFIADLKGIDFDSFAELTTKTSKDFFNLS